MNRNNSNEMMIMHGPAQWQVLQQENGYADFIIDGIYCVTDLQASDFQLMARIVDENDGSQAVYWTRCERLNEENAHGEWLMHFRSIKAGGPYRIETGIALKSNRWSTEFMLRGDIIHHVGIGNLIVVAGQSNSAGFGRETVPDPPEYGVSVLQVSGQWNLAAHPLCDATDGTASEHADILNVGHSPWLSLAKSIKRNTNMPVGIIPLGLNGSSIDDWDRQKGYLYHNMRNMIRRSGNKLSMFIWYQGCTEANSNHYDSYFEKLSQFITALQAEENYTDYPIVVVQINRITTKDDTHIAGWRKVRDAQRRVADTFTHVFCIPTYDIGMISDDVHNNSYANLAIASRVFDCLRSVYDNSYQMLPPSIEKAEISKDNERIAKLLVRNVIGVLEIRKYKGEKYPFVIERETGEEIPIKQAYINSQNEIIIEAMEALHQCYVSYVPQVIFEGNHIYDCSSRLPLIAFDRIHMEDGEEQHDKKTGF